MWRNTNSPSHLSERVDSAKKTIARIRSEAHNPAGKYGHIDKQRLSEIIYVCNHFEKWLKDMGVQQDRAPNIEGHFPFPIVLINNIDGFEHKLLMRASRILGKAS